MAVDQMIGELAAKARKLGASDSLLKARLRRWLALEPPARWLVIEPDPSCAASSLAKWSRPSRCPSSAALRKNAARLECSKAPCPPCCPARPQPCASCCRRAVNSPRCRSIPSRRSLQTYLKRYMPEHATDLVGIASRWSEFQRIGQTMLVAAGLAPESLLVRDATKPGWKRGLEAAPLSCATPPSSRSLPAGCHAIVFRLLGEPSIADLRTREESQSCAAGAQ